MTATNPAVRSYTTNRDTTGSDNILKRSEAAYGCAEDAWKAGQTAFASFEAAVPPSYVRALEEEFAM